MAEYIVALYETESSATAAAGDLEAAGIPKSDIRRYSANQEGASASSNESPQPTRPWGGGFWAWLLGEDHKDTRSSAYRQDAEVYERGAQAGKPVLSVVIHDDSKIHQAITILENHEPIQIDESTDESDPQISESSPSAQVPERTGLAASGMNHPASAEAEPVVPVITPETATPVDPGTVPVAADASPEHEEVISLAEEQVVVGKRTIDRGVTRVRRYVVETPVEKEVTLRREQAVVERRPAEGTGVPVGAFDEQVIEVHETEEIPVVEKTARIVEEVTVRREATERTETIRDTVRREEVEIEGRNGTATPTTPKP